MQLTRRRLLAMSGMSVAVAGCLGDDDPDPGDTDADDDTDMDDDTDVDDDTDMDDDEDMDDEPEDPTIAVDSHPEYGDILVDAEGMTLYNFDNDTQGEGASTCYDDCEANWPPLTVDGEPVAGDGVTAELTTFERDDGSVQVAADGWPLYYFTPDEEPGDTMGQGVNDVWWVLEPDGTLIREVAEEEEEDESGGTGPAY